ncbi:glycosyltransferase 61 family protein [Okeania sp. KiyG1]|uniref:glycosyltransferase 61 family protein n=1 Tax=Okeania sp. KiyG1 TaxID=2720165 RepID=UPI00192264C6|nr:glycosyltransferase 61 family protein [Okeania sp. KiyG1]GGA21541.1 hypothetical protein CYANOKiyG1_36570 [Okeania sp. KiyG1]
MRNYKKAIELNKNSHDILEKIGDLLALKNQWDEAVDYYKIARLNPEFSLEERLIGLGKLKQEQGHLLQAVKLYSRAIQLKESESEPENLPISIVNKGELCQIDLESNKQIIYTEIHPEITSSLEPPKTVHPLVHPLLSEQEKKSGNSSVVVIPGGSVWINNRVPIAIASEEGKILIKDVVRSPDITALPVNNLPPVLELDEPTAFLSVRKEYNYCHWVLDLLPKIGLLQKSGLDLKNISKFVVSSQSERPFQRETLEILGIPSEKIVESIKHPYIKAKTLIIPSLVPQLGRLVTMQGWACQFIKTEFTNSEVRQKLDVSDRIYISRKDAPSRQVINESDVAEFLSKFGIKSVTLTSMSVAEQALLLASAQVVIAPHGAGLTNLLFCNSGTKVIELMSPDAVRPCYYHLSNHCSLDYYYLLGESVDAAKQDMIINIDLLSDLMKLAGIS